MRLLNRPARGDSPGAMSERQVAERSRQQPSGNGGYNPQLGNLGFCLGSFRPGSAGPASQGRGPPQGSGGPGMGAFRSGGPVRAKSDLLGAGAEVRRNRPVTAPTTRGTGSRPASPVPVGGGRASGSRPSSPQPAARSPSPGIVHQQQQQQQHLLQQQQQRSSAGHGVGAVGNVGMPFAQAPASFAQGTSQRSLSSHMRRAPSPTPAFNRNPSPSRPRWRT